MTPDQIDTKPRVRILLAEDNTSNQVLARRALESAGFEVEIAENGREAVTLFKNIRYDLILMDLQMPEMDGFEATRNIRSAETTRRIPVIAFSALPLGEYRERCRESGIDDCVQKPFDEKVLLRTVRKWLDWRPVVLIVDDVEESRSLIEGLISRMKHYRTVSAANGIQAIKSLKDQEIALILMDMEMPVMDGYTAARTIKAIGKTSNIPIIAMTAHEGESEIKKCMKAGCSGYLHKPVTRCNLLSVIREHVPRPGRQGQSNCREEYVQISREIQELIPGYLENRRKDVAAITSFLEEGNLEEVRRLGHNMAGSGGGYGFQKISGLGKEIEKAALAGDLTGIERVVRQLSDYLGNVIIVTKEE